MNRNIIPLFFKKDRLKFLPLSHYILGMYIQITEYRKNRKISSRIPLGILLLNCGIYFSLAEELVGGLVVQVHGLQHVLLVFVGELCKAIFGPGKDAGVDHVSFSIFIVGDGNYVIVAQISCGDIGDVYVVLTALCYEVRAMVLVLPAASA